MVVLACNRPELVVVFALIFACFNAAAVGMRFHARRRTKQRFLADDWLTIPAMMLNVGVAVIMIHGAMVHVFGFRTPEDDADFYRVFTIAQRDEWVFYLLSIPTLGLIKLSILSFYQRIFVVSVRDRTDLMNIAIWIGYIVTGLWSLFFFLRYVFACGVQPGIWWDYNADSSKCGSMAQYMLALCITDFVCDVLIIVLPLPSVWRLHLPLSQKVGASGAFALGGFAIVASGVRMAWVIWEYTANPDIDYAIAVTTYIFWTYMEATVGLIAACLPPMRSYFFRRKEDSRAGSHLRTGWSRHPEPSLKTIDSASIQSPRSNMFPASVRSPASHAFPASVSSPSSALFPQDVGKLLDA